MPAADQSTMTSTEAFYIGSIDDLAAAIVAKMGPKPKAEPLCKMCKLIAYEKHLSKVDDCSDYMLLRSGRRVYRN